MVRHRPVGDWRPWKASQALLAATGSERRSWRTIGVGIDAVIQTIVFSWLGTDEVFNVLEGEVGTSASTCL